MGEVLVVVAHSYDCLVSLEEDSPGQAGAGGGSTPSSPSSGSQRGGGLGPRCAVASARYDH